MCLFVVIINIKVCLKPIIRLLYNCEDQCMLVAEIESLLIQFTLEVSIEVVLNTPILCFASGDHSPYIYFDISAEALRNSMFLTTMLRDCQ